MYVDLCLVSRKIRGNEKKKKKIVRTCTLAEMGMGMRPSDWEICLSCSGNLISGNINHGYCFFFFFSRFHFFVSGLSLQLY